MKFFSIKSGANNYLKNKSFIIKNENDKFSLEIDINKENIFFILKIMNNSWDFYFQKKIKIEEIINKLKLLINILKIFILR